MVVVQYVLPAIRALVMKELVERHHMGKMKAAVKMAVTPAAGTQYIKGERGAALLEEITRSERARQIISELAEALMKNEIAIDAVINKLCKACNIVRSEGIICDLHMKELPALRESKCYICEYPLC
jgi:predicted transcriptional regulator